MSCTNSRNLMMKNNFSTADDLHISFKWCINIVDKVFCSDEAWFHLSGYVNSQNNRILNVVHFRCYCRHLSLGYIKHGEKCKSMHCECSGEFQQLIMMVFVF
jgi:hypothetical protein